MDGIFKTVTKKGNTQNILSNMQIYPTVSPSPLYFFLNKFQRRGKRVKLKFPILDPRGKELSKFKLILPMCSLDSI
jgi:hypothetical protein